MYLKNYHSGVGPKLNEGFKNKAAFAGAAENRNLVSYSRSVKFEMNERKRKER